MNQEAEIPKQFDYKAAEGRVYELWENSGIFHPMVDAKKKPFCVVIPPPNVTGILHMGHILDNVPQDIMTRWHRMRGFSALWIPGTDHAGIATQNVVERQLLKEGIKPKELGREKFIEKVWEWREKHGSIIIQQLKRLGCSCDWMRERFTMDERLSKAVLTAFIHYYKKGLVYKGKRMINWCTRCGTALADDEVEHATHKSSLWHFRYPILDGSGKLEKDNFIVVATTRPETMLGDTAVAVNPVDARYTGLVGKNVLLPLQNRKIPIIADEFVDPKFGTGVVKVTPAHDPNDYQIGLKHNLPLEIVIGEGGKMTTAAGSAYAGLDRQEARKRVVADLEAQGLVEKIEAYSHAVGECYRCHTVIEPLISEQWFVKMRPLAEKAKQAVIDGAINIVPESEKHDYFHWMDTIQDWCISRQLWWGHRIPIYYCDSCGNIMAEMAMPKHCSKCSSPALRQDEDVLDTWFSSQLWPFSTLGWPEKTDELTYWYPNTWLMSGRDILFFWDARMIMSGLELMGSVPFRTLALHGMVRDEHGRKLSKSLGNSPDPLKLFDDFGTDAVRAAIILHYPMGRQDTRLASEIYRVGQGFITKLWNATRLLMMSAEGKPVVYDSAAFSALTLEDRWIISRLGRTVAEHDRFLEHSDFAHALGVVHSFFWSELCDWYLEIIKPRMRANDPSKMGALSVAMHCLRTLLKLFHPYTPFVTEELWQTLNKLGVSDKATLTESKILASVEWPASNQFAVDAHAEAQIETMMSIVRGIREIRHNLNIAPRQELSVKLHFFDTAKKCGFAEISAPSQNLGVVSSFEIVDTATPFKGHVPYKIDGGVAYVAIPADIDVSDTSRSLETKIAQIDQALSALNSRLSNAGFLSGAAPEVVEESKRKALELAHSREKLSDFLRSIR